MQPPMLVFSHILHREGAGSRERGGQGTGREGVGYGERGGRVRGEMGQGTRGYSGPEI